MRSPLLLRLALLLLACSTLTIGQAVVSSSGPNLGLQTWTCRNMNFDQVVAFAVKHGITRIQFIASHLDPKGSPEESLRKKAVLEAHGLTAYTFGVSGTTLDKEENRKLFEFAKLMGISVIILEPKDQAQWDNLEELMKEYDIKLAIHNHGTGSVYGDPATVMKILEHSDPRIGVCLDVGWVTAAGFDAAEIFRSYGDRVFDIHFKDKIVETATDGKKIPLDTEIGKGSANYPGLFAAIKASGWSGVMAIETDSKAFAEDPNRLVSEAKAFFASQVSSK